MVDQSISHRGFREPQKPIRQRAQILPVSWGASKRKNVAAGASTVASNNDTGHALSYPDHIEPGAKTPNIPFDF